MSSRFRLEDLTYRKLDEKTDLSSFSCSVEDDLGVDEFIHKEAINYQKEHFGITYLFYHNEEIVGFVTIAMGVVKANELSEGMEEDSQLEIKTFPSLLIGKLGVDNRYRRRDVGRILCAWCVGKALEFSEDIGCRYVSLVTKKSKIGFYNKCRFFTANPNKERIVMMKRIT